MGPLQILLGINGPFIKRNFTFYLPSTHNSFIIRLLWISRNAQLSNFAIFYTLLVVLKEGRGNDVISFIFQKTDKSQSSLLLKKVREEKEVDLKHAQ